MPHHKHLFFSTRLWARLHRVRKMLSNYGVALFLVFLLFSGCALYLLRDNMIKASHSVGLQLAQRISFSAIYEYQKEKDFLSLMAYYAGERLKQLQSDGMTEAEIRAQLFDFIDSSQQRIAAAFPKIKMAFYAVYKDELISRAKPLPNYNPLEQHWFKLAVKHPGSAVLVDPYRDAVTGSMVITIAATLPELKFTAACDIYTEQSAEQALVSDIPSGFNAYITDTKGNVIFYQNAYGSAQRSNVLIHQQGRALFAAIRDHVKHTAVPCKQEQNNSCHMFELQDSPLLGPHMVYYCHDASTNWFTIITAPKEEILLDFNYVVYIFIGLIVCFGGLEAWMLWRGFRVSRQLETNTEALKVLGNSFQDIVRVNFRTGRFTLLKARSYFRSLLGQRRDYADFMQVMQHIISPEHWPDFAHEYSLQNLEHLATHYIRDLGHDLLIRENSSGHYMWFNVRILFDESLDLDESIISFKQIDAEKIKEIEEHKLLKDTLALSRRNEKAKNAFFANMSHDMRTPLSGILGLCQLAEAHRDNAPELTQIISKINLSARQLLLLVDDILEVSRPEMTQSLNNEPFDLQSFLNLNLDVFRIMGQQSQRSFKLVYDIVHSKVIGDSQKLRQILTNLISNSFKYSHDGASICCLIKEVYEQQTYTKYIFEVSDNGIGMSEDFIAKLFEPYSREQRLPGTGGTGLGLSIVRNLVALMGGDIQVKSKLNEGTVFTITLPLTLQQDSAVALTKREEPLPQESPLKGMHILLAEDNDLNRDIACDLLRLRGVVVLQAKNGQEAVERFKAAAPFSIDAILMDMRMPVMDGCTASFAIRNLKRPDAQLVPIIAVTANAFAEDIAATHAAGMDAHVSKPMDFALVEKTLARLCAQRRRSVPNTGEQA